MSEEKASLVFIPLPVFSHFLSTLKMAKLLADADDRLSITVLITKLQFTDAKISSYINSSSDPRISFIDLDSPETSEATAPTRIAESQVGPVKAAVSAITGTKNSGKIAAVFVDIIRLNMIGVAAELGVPAFVFFTCGAAILGLMFRLQALISDRGDEFAAAYEDSDAEVEVSTYVSPVPAKVWPGSVFERDSGFTELTRRLREANGIVVNSFLELEPHAVEALAGEEGVPAVYPVGPLLQDDVDDRDPKRAEILRWLDEQPDSSVVFLCFGTHGTFGEDQAKEIAAALERSGERFLWSLRKPPSAGTAGPGVEHDNPGEMLPEGFLERTAATGKVIGWAPQMAVLSHRAVGGFVSHCGWNSILESVWCGVPIAAWPMYAEQQANAFQVVKEMEIGVEIQMDYRKKKPKLVNAEKIEKGIKQLMERESKIRENVKELKEKSRIALEEGGSSRRVVNGLIQDLTKNPFN